MRVEILYFGMLRELVGGLGATVELNDGATVGDLIGILRGRTSNSAMDGRAEDERDEGIWRSLAVAVNREYASSDAVLREGDEVALLPPVSGGCGAKGEVRSSLGAARTAGDGLCA